MVGIVVVSHSQALAEGVVTLAREMGGAELAIEAAGGLDEPGVLGTDAQRVNAAIERAMSDDGVLVLMDLGSALLSAEFAIEMLGAGSDRVRLSDAPLVEGAVAAAAAASGGATLDEVAAEARDALKMKASQLGPGADGGGRRVGVAAGRRRTGRSRDSQRGGTACPAGRPPDRARPELRRRGARWPRRPAATRSRATSLTNVIALGARCGDTLLISASGPQARQAVDALAGLVREGLGDGISAGPTAAPAAPTAAHPLRRPPHRRATPQPLPAQTMLTGIAASPGIALGPARRLHHAGVLEAPSTRAAESPERERERLQGAIAGARAAIEADRRTVAARATAAEAQIFDAHLSLLSDEAMLDRAADAITAGASAERGWHEAAREVAAIYRGLEEPLLRERAADVLDVGQRVLAVLQGEPAASIGQAGIVITAELTPADAVALDSDLITGIATAHGAPTAHAAILARALGMPAVVGLGETVLKIGEGATVLLDGDAGTLVLEPSESTARAARERAQRRERWRTAALAARSRAGRHP